MGICGSKSKSPSLHFAWKSPKKELPVSKKIFENSHSGSSVISQPQEYTIHDFEYVGSNEQDSSEGKPGKYRHRKRKNINSKLEIKFYDPVESENTLKPIETRPKLTRPLGVATDNETKLIYLTDSVNNCVQVFSQNLEYLFHFPRWEVRPCGDILKCPSGITIINGKIFVSESKRNEIAVFSLNGDYIGRIDKTFLKDSKMRMKNPQGLASDVEGKIYVCDSEKGRIFIFSQELIPISLEMGKGSLIKPLSIQIQNEKIFILDREPAQMVIKIFDTEGHLLNKLTNNIKSGLMTVSNDNRILLASTQDKSVTVLQENGVLLRKVSHRDTISATNRLYKDDRVLMYEGSNTGINELVWIDV